MSDFRLVELVRQNEHLYDKNRADYKDITKKNNTWDSIAAQLQNCTDKAMKIDLKPDVVVTTPGTSQLTKCYSKLKTRLKEQKEAAPASRQLTVKKEEQSLERRKIQRKKEKPKKLLEVDDALNPQSCTPENQCEPTVRATANKQKQRIICNKVIVIPRLSLLNVVKPSRLFSKPQGNRKKGSQTQNSEQKRAYEREKKRKQREKIRNNPAALAKYRQLERNQRQKQKAEGKLKSINQMNTKEQKRQRKIWKANKVSQRKRKRELQDMNNNAAENSPPISPENLPAFVIGSTGDNTKKTTGRKELTRDHTKTYREPQETKLQLESQERQTEKLKEKCQRTRKSSGETPTPRKPVKEILKKDTSEIKKQLLGLFGATLASQLKSNTGDSCQKRFRSLRDRFNRIKKEKKSSMAVDPAVPKIIKKMMFLYDHVSHRPSSNNSTAHEGMTTAIDATESDETTSEPNPLEFLEECEFSVQESLDTPEEPTVTQTSGKRKRDNDEEYLLPELQKTNEELKMPVTTDTAFGTLVGKCMEEIVDQKKKSEARLFILNYLHEVVHGDR